jgi:hypothetical protein
MVPLDLVTLIILVWMCRAWQDVAGAHGHHSAPARVAFGPLPVPLRSQAFAS